MNVLAFAGSNSKKSINRKLVTWVVQTYWSDEDVRILDLKNFEMPVFGVDREAEEGFPDAAYAFADEIDWADLIVMSLAEHNGAYTVAFKNTLDWLSRLPERSVFMDKPLLLMATSPGARGGSSVLKMAEARFPFNGGRVTGVFSLPSFKKNFDTEQGILDKELKSNLDSVIEKVKGSIG